MYKVLFRTIVTKYQLPFLCNKNFVGGSRFASNLQPRLVRNQSDLRILSEDEEAAFKEYLPKFIQDATQEDIFNDHPSLRRRLGKFLEYNSPNGKFLRQHLFIDAYKSIEKHYGKLSSEKMELAHQMAWCMEMRNDQLILVDDIADNHEFRRGKKSWYKLEDIGQSAVQDIPLLDFSLFLMVKKYFCHHKNYDKILELFLRLEGAAGFVLEQELKNFDDFTPDTYNDIAQMKVTYFCFKHPFYLATLLADKGYSMNGISKRVFELFGWLYSMQNDVLDCYGEELCGKLGSDIQENRCSGLIIMALRKASPIQRKLLKECYGKHDEVKVKKVKEIYEELDVLGEYYKMEKSIRDEISQEIEKFPDEFTRSLISKYADVFCFSKAEAF